MTISNQLNEYKTTFIQECSCIATLPQALDLKSSYIGKTGFVSEVFKKVAALSIDEKKIVGIQINELKTFIDHQINEKINNIKLSQINEKFKKEKVDITTPNNLNAKGKLHPITQVVDEIVAIFKKYGFDLRFDREIETSFYNFDALNFATLHPARSMHDTFFVDIENQNTNASDINGDTKNNDYILRTHTSSVQIRSMQGGKPPFCFLSPGRTYRCDMDRTHTPMFNQIEGVLIEKNISFANLKWIIEQFLHEFFDGMDITVRFRPSFFPFTEPSAEVDIGIKVNEEIKYLEVLGCGLIHPNVLTNCQIDANIWSGFAFGLGVERFAMLKYSMNDLRDFFDNKKWWLSHYGF